ncbi:DUF3429 domain-containing protein [Rhodoligotrophos defluvii]|uniref:DUF3429 domain-containing protein n=1 Tax=Rhodoligotrophos defluvii TaxID=2561934 RepID=UPI001484DF6F|nr:DUF3429 domain-containing protein [Rhodoligotrophos defluvii]
MPLPLDDPRPARGPTVSALIGTAFAAPFAAAAVAVWLTGEPQTIGRVLVLVLVYGAATLAFAAGMRGGAAFGPYSRRRIARQLSLSFLPALAAVVILLLPPIPAVALLIGAFVLQAMWDVGTLQRGTLPKPFSVSRLMLAAISIVSLLAILARLMLTVG